MLKLLVVSELNASVRDGSTTHLQMLLTALDRQGHDIHLLLPQCPGPVEVPFPGTVTRLPVSYSSNSSLAKALGLHRFQTMAKREIPLMNRKNAYDACYIREGIATYGAIAGAKKAGLTTVVEVNGMISQELVDVGYPSFLVNVRDALEGPRLRMADAHVVVSKGLAKRYAARYGISKKKVTVVPNGVDAEMFFPRDVNEAREQWGIRHNRPIVSWVGYMVQWQDLTTLLKAWKLVSKRFDALLLLAGDGPDRMKLERISAKLGLGASVQFLGRIFHERIPLLLQSSDVTAASFVGKRPCSPLKIFEYMACAKPVVVSDIPDALFVKQSRCGLVFPGGDYKAMADSLFQLLDNPDMAVEMGRRGRDLVEKRYTWDNTAKKVMAVIRRAGAD